MKATELIAALQQLVAEHGPGMEVFLQADDGLLDAPEAVHYLASLVRYEDGPYEFSTPQHPQTARHFVILHRQN